MSQAQGREIEPDGARPVMTADERAELERLRLENAKLPSCPRSATAVGIRHRATGLLRRVRGGPSANSPVGTWVRAHMRGLRIGAVALAALVFVFLNQPSGAAILVIAAGLLVVLGLIEFLGRGEPEAAAPPPAVG